MQDFFAAQLNKHTLEAIKNDAAFFMQPGEMRIPIISDSFSGNPITGANYFNLKLANDLNGTSHTEYVKMNEVLASKSGWVSSIPPENRPKGTLYQEETLAANSRYSFVIPTAELNQNIFRDSPGETQPRKQYVPFQTNNASINNFSDFVQEQFTNAINASLTGTVYKSNIRENDYGGFKEMLVDAIAKDPDFMAEIANKAHQNVMDYHYVPFDKKSFIERARVENSYEFNQLNSAIAAHIENIHAEKKPSFNREFNELAQPVIIKIENIPVDSPDRKDVIGKRTAEFVREKIKQDKPAAVLADTFVGTFIEKAVKLANVGKKVFSGVAIACALVAPALSVIEPALSIGPAISLAIPALSLVSKKIGDFMTSGSITPTMHKDEYRAEMTLSQAVQFVKNAAEKYDRVVKLSPDAQTNSFVKIAENIIASQLLKGDTSLRSCRDNGNPHSLFSHLNQTIRDNPRVLDHAVSQLQHHKPHHKTHAMALS